MRFREVGARCGRHSGGIANRLAAMNAVAAPAFASLADVVAHRAYLVRFDAPAIYYFDHHLPEFEALLPTFKLL